MKIILTYPTPLSNELKMIHQLFADGLEILHVRKPTLTEQDYFAFIQQIDSKYHDRLVVCSFQDVGLKMGFQRFHFSRTDYLNRDSFEEFDNCPLSTSTHSIGEFNALNDRMDYAFLSPVFESISKQGYRSERNLLEEIKQRTNFNTKLIALGGITEGNRLIALENGFDGVAMMGDVWKDKNLTT
ncbi:MAG TPA: thiamine phosphate synthase [Taishania sp.]|nr:thiamine phosphate synthase [Taishania sp.]